jgi:hypothetical protein
VISSVHDKEPPRQLRSFSMHLIMNGRTQCSLFQGQRCSVDACDSRGYIFTLRHSVQARCTQALAAVVHNEATHDCRCASGTCQHNMSDVEAEVLLCKSVQDIFTCARAPSLQRHVSGQIFQALQPFCRYQSQLRWSALWHRLAVRQEAGCHASPSRCRFQWFPSLQSR